MIYPYNLLKINRHAIFDSALMGEGVFIPLSNEGEAIQGKHFQDQQSLQIYGNQLMADYNTNWAISEFGENREKAFRLFGYPQMVNEGRFFHLGLDVWLPQNSPLHSPYNGRVVESLYEKGPGNYGGMVVIEYLVNDFTFYIVFGHLNKNSLVKEGTKVMRGDLIGRVGGMDSNGGYFIHTHLQVLTEKGYREGFAHKGYATKVQFGEISNWCLDPRFLTLSLKVCK